jgi:hypothetical protein
MSHCLVFPRNLGLLIITWGIFLTPVFFFVLMWLGERKSTERPPVRPLAAAAHQSVIHNP